MTSRTSHAIQNTKPKNTAAKHHPVPSYNFKWDIRRIMQAIFLKNKLRRSTYDPTRYVGKPYALTICTLQICEHCSKSIRS